jgi:hypothetical protein
LALAINDSSYPMKKSSAVVDWVFFLRGGVMSIVWSHLRDGIAIVSDSFINSTQTFRSVESRSPIGEQDSSMANFAIGDVVKKDKGRTGTVRAIFTTMAGELCYAVEHEGAVDFVEEAKLSDSPKTDLAA